MGDDGQCETYPKDLRQSISEILTAWSWCAQTDYIMALDMYMNLKQLIFVVVVV